MKRFKDRKDARRLSKKEMTGMAYINCDLKKKRAYREVYMNVPMDVTEMIKYVEKQNNSKKNVHITYFHVFCTAIAKTIYNYPNLNIFSMNGNFYMRNDVILSFVAKKEFTDEAKEVMQMLKVEADDNIFTLSERISGGVKKARKESGSDSGGDNLVNAVGHLPTFLRRPIVGIFKFLDRHDLLPTSLTSEILYYSSVILSNIGTLNSKRGIYHDLTDFGTNSILATMGRIYKQEIINDDVKKEIKDFCDFGITLDEGIGDGYYFIKAVNFLEYLLKNPKLLEGPANEKIEVK